MHRSCSSARSRPIFVMIPTIPGITYSLTSTITGFATEVREHVCEKFLEVEMDLLLARYFYLGVLHEVFRHSSNAIGPMYFLRRLPFGGCTTISGIHVISRPSIREFALIFFCVDPV